MNIANDLTERNWSSSGAEEFRKRYESPRSGLQYAGTKSEETFEETIW